MSALDVRIFLLLSEQRSGTRKAETPVEDIYRAVNKHFAIPVEDVRKAVEDELKRNAG